MSELRALAVGESRHVRLWDLPTRLYHWGQVALVALLMVSGKAGWMGIHTRAGEALLALVLFRLSWGFLGSRHARFTDFLAGPRRVLAYIASHHRKRAGKPAAEPKLGHNPLGGWMVMALLLVLLTQAGLGLFANDDILTEGPLFHLVGKDVSDLATVIHKALFNILAAMVALHVVAVCVHQFVVKDDLLRPMISGRKTVPAAAPVREAPFVGLWRAVLLLAAAAAAVWALLRFL